MTTAPWHLSAADAAAQLPDTDEPMRFAYVLEHGTMKTGYYAPNGRDVQGPHTRDELYFIVSGTGVFMKNGERRTFAANDAIFVEAGAEHRFEEFTDDFAAWVVFWGPEGGEAAGPRDEDQP